MKICCEYWKFLHIITLELLEMDHMSLKNNPTIIVTVHKYWV